MAEKLRKYHGNLAAVGRDFGVTRTAVYNYVKARPTLQEVCAECREVMTDHAESALFKQVLDGDFSAVKWYLATQGRDRGYVEKQEVEHGGEVTVKVRRDDNFYGTANRLLAAPVAASSTGAESPVAVQGSGLRPALGKNGAGTNGHD